ncbi:CDP-glycerol glycerophosphotransferase family protein [uncultured Dubosiella sp.]|uniref:CDP-glycerol glycerophosphotransferase family protein n=4 Tax=uncultured Dubosiella sp. TaxID=1937011 RepID=UPI002730DF93|nr:CDP-glycerol glycerophosphotransferase family protein [uncultured Dubosiella sp.]
MRFRKLINKFKSDASNFRKYSTLPICENHILLEAGQGKNTNGNMFALLEEICRNPKWKSLHPVFVVTEETKESAKKRFAFYGWNIELVIRDSEEYKKKLASAKYLLTDNSFPVYFLKRDEQVYLNTWHGTPLKTLGKSDLENAVSLSNIQKNYLMCDYALFPNPLTEAVFMKDYMLENLYRGKILSCDYPRNWHLADEAFGKKMRQTLGLNHQRVFAYMPTWRGTGRKASIEIQKKVIEGYLKELDEKLADDQVLLVNLHFLVGNTIDFSTYRHVRAFPSDYETYDVLSACDGLITDYSSVMFDFGVTNRKIILFTYDLEEYMSERGTYFSIDKLPFPQCETVEEVVQQFNDPKVEDRTLFWNEFCPYRAKDIPEKIIDLLTTGNPSDLRIENAPNNGKENLLVYVGNLNAPAYNEYIAQQIVKIQRDHPDHNIVVAFRGVIRKKEVEFIRQLPETIQFYGLVKKYGFYINELIRLRLSLESDFFYRLFKKSLKPVLEMERKRHFYSIEPAQTVTISRHSRYMDFGIESFPCPKTLEILPRVLVGTIALNREYKAKIKRAPAVYSQIIDNSMEDVHDLFKDDPLHYYNYAVAIGNVRNSFRQQGRKWIARSVGVLLNPLDLPVEQLQIKIHDEILPSRFHTLFRLGKGRALVSYTFALDYEEIERFDIQNKVYLSYTDSRGFGLEKGILYRIQDRRKGELYQGKVIQIPEYNTSVFFRQSKNNLMYFTVRKTNISDTPWQQLKINAAYFLAKLLPKKKSILMFEKESARYEESASVVYERLIDQGYENVDFVLDPTYPFIQSIPKKYRSHIVFKGSFKHYLKFFRATTFIGSEMLVHSIDLRIANRHALKKLEDKNNNYVFLQHGVMYMVSLDSESRRFFKPLKLKGKYRVVTSSVAEARHFIELGGYPEDVLYITGLPKFDKNEWLPTADRIVIMPTWRPWEYNEARYDFTETKYYHMIERMIEAIPESLREKVTVLVHPLFLDAVKGKTYPLQKYISTETKYDDVLKQAKILITDYSSIAYDAFYRGSNVIFYWEEKDESLENYGENTKLMLNPDNAFGDICMNASDLSACIVRNYESGQVPLYRKRYKELVTFEDGKNTDRLIECLKKDEIV